MTILLLLLRSVRVQLLYDAILCVWLLSFNDRALEALKATKALKNLTDVARTSSKEKASWLLFLLRVWH